MVFFFFFGENIVESSSFLTRKRKVNVCLVEFLVDILLSSFPP